MKRRQHEKEVLRIQVEADRIRLQETTMSREMNDSANRSRNSERSPTFPVFSEAKDDMDAYIQRFERYAENEGWDADCYGTYLGSPFIRQSVGSLFVTTRVRST